MGANHSDRDGVLVLLPVPADEAGRLQFRQESRTLARLRHPHLATVDDFGFLPDGRPFLRLARPTGEPLQGPIAPERLLALLRPLSSALGYVHRHGLIHGAVARANLLIDPQGRPTLLGPYAVRPAGRPVAPAPGAPEEARGERVDARTDLYALGATCFELLTGRPYGEGELGDEVPAGMAQAIARLLAPEPAARPRSATEALALFGLQPPERAEQLLLEPTFTGRAEELALFQREVATAKGPRVLAFAGSAGAGKTRLLDELRTLARLEGVPWLEAACGVGAARPFGPFAQLFKAPGIQEAAGALGLEQRAALGRAMPELGLAGGPDALEPREERLLVQAAICQVLRAVAPGGAVLAFDDWDRADGPSVEAMAYLRRNAGGTPFLVVTTGREAGYLGAGARSLPPLGRDETAQLAASMLGEGRPPASFLAALHRWTGGHPGQAQRIVAHLVQAGTLELKGGRWQAPRGLAAGDLAPELLELARAPLSALTEPAARLAELVAVLEADADLAALAELAQLEEDVLFQALAELQARQVVLVADGRVRFASGGLQQAAYERANQGRRLWLHAQAALHLEDALADGRRADVEARIALVRHAVASEQLPKAMPLLLPAAELLMARFEVDVARTLLRDALALADAWPGGGDHAAWRRDVLVNLAAIERWRGDPDAMAACLDEAQPLAEALGEPGPLLKAWVLRAAHHNLQMKPRALQEGIALLERALALPVRDPVWQVRGRFFLAQAHFYRGQAPEAAAAFAEAAAAAERDGLPFWQANALAFQGYLQAGAGDEAGFGLLASARRIQEGLGDRYGLGFTLALQGDALLGALRLAEAEPAFDAQQAVAQELGVGEDHVTGLVNLATVRVLAGQFPAALEACQLALPQAEGLAVGLLGRAVRALALAGAGDLAAAAAGLAAIGTAGTGYMFLHALPFLMEAWRWLGRPDEVLALAQAARPAWRTHPNPGLQAQALALEAEALLARDGPAAARQPLQEAQERAGGSPLARLLALRARARVELAEGQPGAAHEAVAEAVALARAAGARALEAELEGLRGDLPAMRALELDAPILRALALGPTDEARALLRALAEGLEPLARSAFLAGPACAAAVGTGRARQALADRKLAALEQLAAELDPALTLEAMLGRVAAIARAHGAAAHAQITLAGATLAQAGTSAPHLAEAGIPLSVGPDRAVLVASGDELTDDDLAVLAAVARHAAPMLAARVALDRVSAMYQSGPKPRRAKASAP